MRLSAIIVAFILTACTSAARSDPRIDRYVAAECLPAVVDHGMLVWNDSLDAGAGRRVELSARYGPARGVYLRFLPETTSVLAVYPRTYLYLVDLRLDRANAHLIVRASGPVMLLRGNQTWLFRYDLQRRRQTDSVRVDPTVLPAVCTSPPTR